MVQDIPVYVPFIYMYIKEIWGHTNNSYSSTIRMNRVHCSFLLLLTCKFFLWQGETLLLLNTIYYLSSPSMHVRTFKICSWWFVPSYFMIFLVVNWCFFWNFLRRVLKFYIFIREDLYLILLVMERLFFCL